MEFRKRSRSNPLNDDNDDDLIHINNYNSCSNRFICCKFIVWVYRKITCFNYRINKIYKLPV